jgi:hypothetical protein
MTMSMRDQQISPRSQRCVANGHGTTIGVRCRDPLLKMLDDYRRNEPDLPTRASALRRLAIVGLDALKRGKHTTIEPRFRQGQAGVPK